MMLKEALTRAEVDSTKKMFNMYLKHLMQLQEDCEHRGAVRVPKSDTGNWDKADDRYWYECKCPTCDKEWTEDQ